MSITTFTKWSLCVLTFLGFLAFGVLLLTPWGPWMHEGRMLGLALWTMVSAFTWLVAECITDGKL